MHSYQYHSYCHPVGLGLRTPQRIFDRGEDLSRLAGEDDAPYQHPSCHPVGIYHVALARAASKIAV